MMSITNSLILLRPFSSRMLWLTYWTGCRSLNSTASRRRKRVEYTESSTDEIILWSFWNARPGMLGVRSLREKVSVDFSAMQESLMVCHEVSMDEMRAEDILLVSPRHCNENVNLSLALRLTHGMLMHLNCSQGLWSSVFVAKAMNLRNLMESNMNLMNLIATCVLPMNHAELCSLVIDLFATVLPVVRRCAVSGAVDYGLQVGEQWTWNSCAAALETLFGKWLADKWSLLPSGFLLPTLVLLKGRILFLPLYVDMSVSLP